MRIAEAQVWTRLRDAGLQQQRISKEKKLAIELARDIFAEAEAREEPFLYHTPETWARKWLPSKRFQLVRMPLNAAANPCEPKGDNLVLKKIHAMESKPIVVDYNKQQIGKSLHGFVPQIVVIDGKHRFKAAALRGETHIMAWVGEVALEQMQAMGSGGGGPAPERTTPAPGAALNALGQVKIKNNPGMEADGKKLTTLNVKKKLTAGGPGSGRRPGGGFTGYHVGTFGENRSYHLFQGAGRNGGQWQAKEADSSRPEYKNFDSRAEAEDHIKNSQD